MGTSLACLFPAKGKIRNRVQGSPPGKQISRATSSSSGVECHTLSLTHQVDITEAMEPEVVQGVRDERELSGEEASLTLPGGTGKAAHDPGVHGG